MRNTSNHRYSTILKKKVSKRVCYDVTAKDLSMSQSESFFGISSLSSRRQQQDIEANSSNNFGRDQMQVTYSRGLVFFVLVAAASILASLTYNFVSRSEHDGMNSNFIDIADELIEISQENVKKVFGILENFSVEATIQALHGDFTWPFVTLPYFAARGEAALRASEALMIAYIPIVEEKDRLNWEKYSLKHQKWIAESYDYNQETMMNKTNHTTNKKQYSPDTLPTTKTQPIYGQIFGYGDRRERRLSETCEDEARRSLKERVPEEPGTGPYAPVWQLAPPPPPNATETINFNLFNKPVFKKAVDFIKYTRKPVFLDVCNQAKWFGEKSKADTLQTVVVQPIFKDFKKDSEVVGSLVAVLPWQTIFENILHNGAPEVTVVMENTCNEVFSFSVEGNDATYLKEKDLHDTKFTHMGRSSLFADFANPKELLDAGFGEHCVYTMNVYPTMRLHEQHITTNPIFYAFLVVGIFFLTSMIFVVYDCLVQRRQMNLIKTTANMHASLVSSLFPSSVRDRVIDAVSGNKNKLLLPNVDDVSESEHLFGSHPIADLFPEATVMFCDIAGFTAWSSMRGPEQVFTLLETVYHSFDVTAEERGVFKVETIGDSYVAVCGLPEFRKDHAIVMAEFAQKCLTSFNRIVQRLETLLGPETMDLKMRFGLHSGPVTAGVLRGQKARFQLFGDTVNTASRAESTSVPNKIHITRETADLLRAEGKEHWLERRKDVVHAKGKGVMETYWLTVSGSKSVETASIDHSSCHSTDDESLNAETEHVPRHCKISEERRKLVKWNCALLFPHLRKIVARRKRNNTVQLAEDQMQALENEIVSNSRVAQEVVEIIELPEFCASDNKADAAARAEIDEGVEAQLKDYVTLLSSLYNDNAFHSFDHASHVIMSTGKLLSRIVAPTRSSAAAQNEKHLHDHTYGITSDPLTQFSVMLAALIHDVDHQGVSNAVLAKENPVLGKKYNFASIAEQNSVDLAWNALMSDDFKALRRSIYCNESELKHFRQLIVNSIMATDIFDKDLSALRKKRWEKAFSTNDVSATQPQEDVNRKATIVIEHLIQASDVAHTMQHWHVYQKWNTRLFQETYGAYLEGRTDKDPSVGWFGGEIWFFDNYVIPLAKKLKDCGVFGVSSDEYLNYAVVNKREWVIKGKEIVERIKKQCDANHQRNNIKIESDSDDDL